MRRWTTTWLIPATLAVLSVLERTVAQAPGDGDSICSAPNRAIGYPDYVRPLMDSWNYEVLLSPNVWNQVSLDSTKTPRGEWRAVGNCNGGTVAVCSVLPGEQNNWLFTQHINKSVTVNDSYPVRVFVNITSTFVYCDNCSPLIMVLKYFTNTQQQTDIYTNIKNYTPDGIMPRNTIKYFEATVTDHFYFDMDQDEDGLYFALQDYNMENRNRGACLTVSRMLVYRYECHARRVGVVRYPTIQAPISGNVPIGVECIENAHPLNDSMLVNCTSEGQWEVNSIACDCDPGFFAETDDDITTCRANFKPVDITYTVSEGQVSAVCFITIKRQALTVNARTRDGTAVGNFDYRVLDENITFETNGTSQCVTIHIANDSLVEEEENFNVVLLNRNIILSQTTVYISSNGVATNNSCVDGSVSLVSDVEHSSLQLVEMCSEGVWSPVCDYNWTVSDAAVVCKESGYSKQGSYKVLESRVSHHARTVPSCVGNETSLFDCKELLDSDVACNYVLVECTEEAAEPTPAVSTTTNSSTATPAFRNPEPSVSITLSSADTTNSLPLGPIAFAAGSTAVAIVVLLLLIAAVLLLVILRKKKSDQELSRSNLDNPIYNISHSIEAKLDHENSPTYEVIYEKPPETAFGHEFINPIYDTKTNSLDAGTLSASCQPEYSTLEESLAAVEYEVPLLSPTTNHSTVAITSTSTSTDSATSPDPEYSAVDGMYNGHVHSCLEKTGESRAGSVDSKEQGSEHPPLQTEGQGQQQYQEEYSVLNHNVH